jgi:hypothetical protein
VALPYLIVKGQALPLPISPLRSESSAVFASS